MNQFHITVVLVFSCSLLISCLIAVFCKHSAKQRSQDLKAVQSAHKDPTPRFGGIAVVSALVLGLYPWLSGEAQTTLYPKLLLSIVPIFAVGLSEDLGYFASPRLRLVAAVVSGALFIWLLGEWLPRTDLPGLDFAMQWGPFAIGFSIFLAVGVSHAFNLIDGLNGLAPLTAMATALAIATISHETELHAHRDVMILLATAIFGFLLLNFPFGKIFLGDAGAYVIGHLLVWMSISILWQENQVTPWAMLLIFFWPIADTLMAILRRFAKGRPIFHPDRLHFHQLVMRAVEITILGQKHRTLSNPIATVITLPFILSPMCAGVMLATERMNAAIAVLLFALLFVATYVTGIAITKKMRNRRKR